jgi:hypothetical protein
MVAIRHPVRTFSLPSERQIPMITSPSSWYSPFRGPSTVAHTCVKTTRKRTARHLNLPLEADRVANSDSSSRFSAMPIACSRGLIDLSHILSGRGRIPRWEMSLRAHILRVLQMKSGSSGFWLIGSRIHLRVFVLTYYLLIVRLYPSPKRWADLPRAANPQFQSAGDLTIYLDFLD